MPHEGLGRWPVYFATQDIPGVRPVRAGELFPVQEKNTIRGYGLALGIPDAWDRPFADLPYVAVVDIDADAAHQVQARKLTLEQARAYESSATKRTKRQAEAA